MSGKKRAWVAGFAACAWLLACAARSATGGDEAACPGCGAVGVSVISAAGTLITTEAYVALIQKGKPPREPLFEAILADAGKGVTWQAPAGDYGVICSALGFGDAFVQPVKLEAARSTPVVCELTPVVHATGRVLSEETGKPIGGATVVPAQLFKEDFQNRLTPVGRQHQWRNQVAVTARDGTYSFPAMPGFRNTYVFHADGAGFKVLENVIVPKGGLTLPDVVLPPGGAVEIDAGVLPGGDPAGVVVALGPYTVRGLETEGSSMLRRHLEPSGRARFDSVPVGVWLVHLELPGGARIYAGTVEITAGGFATMTVALADTKVEGVLRGLDVAEAENTKLSFESWVSEKSVEARVFLDASEPKPTVRYAARFRVAGTYWPTVSGADEQGAQYLGPVTVKSGTGTRTLDLDVPASYRISGTVVNVTGDPVSDAGVTLGHGVWPLCKTTTDRDGRWACGHVRAGDVVLLARKDGVGVSELTKGKAGEGGAPVLLTLKPGRSLTGTISVPERSEQEMTHVAFVLDGFSAGPIRGQSQNDGRFELTTLPWGPGQILARPDKNRSLSFAFRQVGGDEAGEIGQLDVVRAGAVYAAGALTEVSYKQDYGVSVLVFEDVPLSPWVTIFMIGGGGLSSPPGPGAPGLFHRLRPGRYRVRWVTPDGDLIAESRPFTVRSGELSSVSFSTK